VKWPTGSWSPGRYYKKELPATHCGEERERNSTTMQYPVFTCSIKRFCGEVRCEERFTWTYSDLDLQVLHFDIFRIRRCDITFIIFVPSSTVLTEMSFDRPFGLLAQHHTG
jgi:hypothetical protein